MCRNIRVLANFEPPATPEEIRASSLQYVRKLSGMNKPSQANQAAMDAAVEEIFAASTRLIERLVVNAPPRNRLVEAEKAKVRARKRFG